MPHPDVESREPRDRVDAYRAVASETTPPRLDAAVLEMARSEAGRTVSDSAPALWWRPVAAAAVLVLGIAVTLRLADSPEQRLSPESPFEGAAVEAAAQYDDAASRAASNLQNDAAQPSPTPGDDPVDIERTNPLASRCDETARATASAWWSCIQALELAGHTDLAEAELKALLGAFPGTTIDRNSDRRP